MAVMLDKMITEIFHGLGYFCGTELVYLRSFRNKHLGFRSQHYHFFILCLLRGSFYICKIKMMTFQVCRGQREDKEYAIFPLVASTLPALNSIFI